MKRFQSIFEMGMLLGLGMCVVGVLCAKIFPSDDIGSATKIILLGGGWALFFISQCFTMIIYQATEDKNAYRIGRTKVA